MYVGPGSYNGGPLMLLRGTWLSRVVSWFVNYYAGDILNEDSDLEVTESVERIQGLYAAAQDGVRPSHKVFYRF